MDEEDEGDDEGEAALAELEREARGLAAPPVHPATSEPVSAAAPTKCVDCGDVDGQTRFFEAFGISVCYDCQRERKGPGGKYQVITKSTAKSDYLLTDRHLNREYGGLGCLVMPNPHDSRYGDMRLFLKSQVEELALSVWGSDEGLFDEKERRADERMQKAAARERKAQGRSNGISSGGIKKKGAAASGSSSAAQAQRLAAARAAAAHKHEFLPDETYDEAKDTWTKRCACGFEVEYERM